MSSDWNSVSLGECVEFDTGFPFKSAQYTESEAGVRLLRGDNIGQGSLRWEGAKRWIRKANDSLEVYELRQNDLVLAMDRPWIAAGLKFAKVRDNDLPALLVQRVARLRPKPHMDVDYLHSVISSPDFTLHIQNVTTGTAVPHISGRQIQDYKFALPDLGTQRSVGKFLMSLDDRITLLRETNDTLEAIAQALFKSWFVDFDPVRAKMEGRAPEGMDEATAALFPDSLEESELGLVPRGWRIGTLADVARLQKSSVNPLHQPDVLFEHYSLPAFDDGQSPIIEAGIEIKSNKTVVPANAILLSKLNPHIPRVWLPTDAGINAVCSTEFLAFIPADAVSREFIYCIFTSERFLQSLCQLVTGTSNSHQRVKPDGVLSMNSVITPADVMVSFATIAKPIFDRIGHNRQQAQTLANLRDTLLPRLISGQLLLSEVDSLR